MSISEARAHFSELIAAVERGEKIVIARRGKPVAKVSGCDEEPRRKPILGLYEGQVKELDPDWWKPIRDEDMREEFGDEFADDFGAP